MKRLLRGAAGFLADAMLVRPNHVNYSGRLNSGMLCHICCAPYTFFPESSS